MAMFIWELFLKAHQFSLVQSSPDAKYCLNLNVPFLVFVCFQDDYRGKVETEDKQKVFFFNSK